MAPKAGAAKQSETKRSVVIVPSKVITDTHTQDLEGVEETEIAAQISVPTEGGWGWVVVAASFFCIFILDGIFFTFGSIYPDMTADLGESESLVALINSIAVAVYFIGGPLVSALINRFGFRACTMCGSILCSIALLGSYFVVGYAPILVLYGIVGGFGACLASMSSGLIVGFYFERLRSVAMALTTCGSSVGVMIMYSVNTYIVNKAGWRVTTLMHSGLAGIIYFLGMTFRPLLSLTVTVTTTEDTDPTRTVTYLPSLAAIKASPSGTKKEGVMPTATERLFSAVSNAHFPTAASVVQPQNLIPQPTAGQPGPSTAPVASKLTLTAHGPQGGLSRRQLKVVQSMISRTSIDKDKFEDRIIEKGKDKGKTKDKGKEKAKGKDKDKDKGKDTVQDKSVDKEKDKLTIEVDLQVQAMPAKRPWWRRLCQWEEHVAQARPMYRDDAFYGGKLEQLPAYQKSKMDTEGDTKTGLEYQMAVSRAVTTAELGERRGVFTTAVRRVLATMMDPNLLKRLSFLLCCFSGCLTFYGYLVPYVFITDRNKAEGIDPSHCSLFVSVMGLANAIGRLVIGGLALKFNPLYLYIVACLGSGVGIIMFNFSFNLYYQYAVCVIFGFFIASLSSIRSLVIVQLFGLEMLTNATGMMLMFQGIGSLIGTPVSSIVKKQFGYDIAFYVAGIVVLLSGLILLPVTRLNEYERVKLNSKNGAKQPPTTITQKS